MEEFVIIACGVFLFVIYLVLPSGKTIPSEACSLADLVHEEAHPVVPNLIYAVLECIQARCIESTIR